MASSSNVSRLPWGILPRSPVTGVASLEVSFRDIMAEQEKESESQDRDFEEYIQKSYVTVGSETTPRQEEIPEVEKSFAELEDLGKDLRMVMSFYEDQDFDDAIYELSEKELNDMADDDCDKYYEGLAKKLSTVVEIQNSGLSTSTRNGRLGGSLPHQPNPESLIDPRSKVMLEKMKQKGILRGALSPTTYKVIHAGRSATVFLATGGMLKRRENIAVPTTTAASILKLRLPKECAIKIYHNNENGDEEARQVEAKREMSFLNRMTRAGIPCPQVQFLHEHILVTEFLGKDGIPAKKLKDANDLTSSRSALKTAYDQIAASMKSLFKTCHLVHGKLSEHTILWHKRQAYFVNVGGAVNSNRPGALESLYRDCCSITEFFEKKGKPGCRSPQQLFQWITGFDYSGDLLSETCGSDFAFV